MPTVRLRFVRKNHARDYHVITPALSLIRVTPRLPSSRFLRAQLNCWYNPVDFQQPNVDPPSLLWLKSLIYLVRVPAALYQLM